MAEEKKLQVDFEGFNRAMKAARERSKTAPKKVFVYFSVPFRCQNSLWVLNAPNKVKGLNKNNWKY